MGTDAPLPMPPGDREAGTTTIEVTAKIRFLQWLLYFFKPTVVVDGIPNAVKWSTHRFPVTPGHHRVEVFFRYLFYSRAGDSAIEVDMAEGQVRRLLYRPPWLVFMKGKLAEI